MIIIGLFFMGKKYCLVGGFLRYYFFLFLDWVLFIYIFLLLLFLYFIVCMLYFIINKIIRYRIKFKYEIWKLKNGKLNRLFY